MSLSADSPGSVVLCVRRLARVKITPREIRPRLAFGRLHPWGDQGTPSLPTQTSGYWSHSLRGHEQGRPLEEVGFPLGLTRRHCAARPGPGEVFGPPKGLVPAALSPAALAASRPLGRSGPQARVPGVRLRPRPSALHPSCSLPPRGLLNLSPRCVRDRDRARGGSARSPRAEGRGGAERGLVQFAALSRHAPPTLSFRVSTRHWGHPASLWLRSFSRPQSR